MSSAVRTVTNVANNLVGNITGTGSNTGILGAGQFRSGGYSIDRSAFDPNSQETAFVRYLQNQAMGTGGPSAAELQLRRGSDMATNNAMALAASQRGVNPALAARMAQMSAANSLQDANQQAGILRAQEQLNSQGMFADMLESQRNARIQREQAGLQNQLGMDQVNVRAYEDAAGRRRAWANDIASGIGKIAGMNEGGMVQKNSESINSKLASFDYEPSKPEEESSSGMSISPEMAKKAMSFLANKGGKVPGHARVKGDSIKNDVVPVMLSPGELVVPRTVVKEGPEAIREFAQSIMKKGGKNGKKAA